MKSGLQIKDDMGTLPELKFNFKLSQDSLQSTEIIYDEGEPLHYVDIYHNIDIYNTVSKEEYIHSINNGEKGELERVNISFSALREFKIQPIHTDKISGYKYDKSYIREVKININDVNNIKENYYMTRPLMKSNYFGLGLNTEAMSEIDNILNLEYDVSQKPVVITDSLNEGLGKNSFELNIIDHQPETLKYKSKSAFNNDPNLYGSNKNSLHTVNMPPTATITAPNDSDVYTYKP